MKRILTTVLVLPFALAILTSAAFADEGAYEYGWTISDSHVDAYSNQGPFIPGLKSLYLWYACNSDSRSQALGGMAAAEFDLLSKNPANIILAFTPKSGFLNAGSATKLLLAVGGCPDAQPWQSPVNAGIILCLNNAPGVYAIAPSNITGTKGTVDCRPNPELHPMQWLGYAHDGQEQQMKDWDKCVKPTSVDNSSWGQVKGVYR